MAHDTLLIPNNLAPLRNLSEFVIQSHDAGAGTYTAVAVLSGPTIPALTLKFSCDFNRTVTIRINKLLKPYAQPTPITGLGDGQRFYFRATTIVTYSLSITFYKDGAAVLSPVTFSNKTAILAGRDYTKIQTAGFVDELVSGRYVSVWLGKRTVTLDEFFCLPMYFPVLPAGSIRLEFFFVGKDGYAIDATGEHQEFYATFTPLSLIYCFVSSVKFLTGFGFGWENLLANLDNVAFFTIQLRDMTTGNLLTGSPLRYDVREKNNLYPLRSFLFLNSKGGYDAITLSGKKESEMENEGQTAQKYFPSNYLIGQPHEEEFNETNDAEYKINTGYITTREGRKVLQDFLMSRERYEMVGIGSTFVPLPIKLTSKKHPMSGDNMPTTGIDLTYKYKFQNMGSSDLVSFS